MTDQEIVALGIPEDCFAAARDVLAAIDRFNNTKNKPDEPYDASIVLRKVVETPLYFVREGGDSRPEFMVEYFPIRRPLFHLGVLMECAKIVSR